MESVVPTLHKLEQSLFPPVAAPTSEAAALRLWIGFRLNNWMPGDFLLTPRDAHPFFMMALSRTAAILLRPAVLHQLAACLRTAQSKKSLDNTKAVGARCFPAKHQGNGVEAHLSWQVHGLTRNHDSDTKAVTQPSMTACFQDLGSLRQI